MTEVSLHRHTGRSDLSSSTWREMKNPGAGDERTPVVPMSLHSEIWRNEERDYIDSACGCVKYVNSKT